MKKRGDRSRSGAAGHGGGPGAGSPHDRHHAERRRARRDRARAVASPAAPDDSVFLYGLHAVRHALENPAREIAALHVTENALRRLAAMTSSVESVKTVLHSPRDLDRMVGPEAVHQGAVLVVLPLRPRSLDALPDGDLVLVLDQVTDPHNVGAILRSAVAFGAGAVVTTARHSPVETGVLAKAASGALDLMELVQVGNLARALQALRARGYRVVGLDSEGPMPLEAAVSGARIALVLGAEGRGLREKTRQTCDALARLDMPGRIRSLNVSNAAALSLYLARRHLAGLAQR